MIVQVLGGDFDKRDDARFGTDEIIFSRDDRRHPDIVSVSEVIRTFHASERTIRLPDSPKQLAAVFSEARKRWSEHANREVVVIFKDGRWVYIRASSSNEAHIIRNICPE